VVILEVFVNQEGSVGDIKVFKSSGYAILDKTAMKSVKKWEFEPGKRGDEKVGMWVRTPVRFQLK
jgi:protein TonB